MIQHESRGGCATVLGNLPAQNNQPTGKYGIMNDLHEIGFKGQLPIFVQNFLSNRESKERVGSTLSEAHNQEQGVPQGSVLPVTLFSLKIKNIVKCLNPGWLVGCFGFNGPLRQYFSLYRTVSQREGEREEKG